MIEFILFLAGLIAIGIVLSICNFFSETYREMKEKERYDREQKKKLDTLAFEAQRKKVEQELEAQRKKSEQELEFRKQAGVDPVYQTQMRKNKQYKVMIACLIALIVLIVSYLIVPKSDLKSETDSSASSIEENIAAPLQEESSIGQENQNLPERFTPVMANERQVEEPLPKTQPTIESKEIVETTVANPFNGNTTNTNVITSDQIAVYDASSYVGENKTVCGEVSQISQTSKATYLNFGGRYPNHNFSAVIWSHNIMPASEGDNICIAGLIESYKGVPQIVIRSLEHQFFSY